MRPNGLGSIQRFWLAAARPTDHGRTEPPARPLQLETGQCRWPVSAKSSLGVCPDNRYIYRVIRAIILAAGASSRMGRPKATLPLTDEADTFLSRLVRTASAAGLPDIVVVTGAHQREVRAAAGRLERHVRFVHNAEWARGQLSSLLTGLSAPPVAPVEAALVTLVDVPLASATTFRQVIGRWRHTRAPIVRPAQGDTHGHPVIFDRALFDELHAADLDAGAKPVVRAHADAIVNVPVDDEGAFLDVDTPEAYDALRARLRAATS